MDSIKCIVLLKLNFTYILILQVEKQNNNEDKAIHLLESIIQELKSDSDN